jgi:hypothetical protein
MGLFGKKHLLPDEQMKKLVTVANEAWNFFPGSLNGAVLSYKRAEVNFLDELDRKEFIQSLGRVLESINNGSSLSTAWTKVHATLGPDADRFALASTIVAKTLVWIEVLAEAELQFPRDGRIRNLRLQLMNEVFAALERYYGDRVLAETATFLPHLQDVLLGPLAGDWTSDD